MKINAFLTLFLISLFLLSEANALPEDSVKKEIRIPTLIKYIDGRAFTAQQVTYQYLDTTLNNIEIVNPAIARHYNYLSNIGSAAFSQVFNLRNDIFTDLGFHTYDLYLYNERKIRYFKTNKAYSEINYHLAAGKEQQITVALSENIFKNWNVGLDFNRLGSQGFLKNGTTFHNNVDLYSWFHSENNRYNLLASATWNSIRNLMNGGVHSDSLYDHTIISNLALQGLLVNLSDAEHHFRSHEFSLKQFYDLGFRTEENSSDTVNKYHFHPAFRLGYAISLEERSFTSIDNNPGSYYRNTFYTSTTLDSLHSYELRNRVSLSSPGIFKNHPDQLRPFNYSIAWEHQWIRYSQFAKQDLQFLDAIMHNNLLEGNLCTREDSNKIFAALTGQYIFEGVNNGNYKADLSIQLPLNQFGDLHASGQLVMKSPEFIYQRYYSNHFIWDTPASYEKSKWKYISIRYALSNYHLSTGAEVTSVSNLIYLDSTASPMQSTHEIQIMKYDLTKNFKFRKIHFNNSFIVQKVNDDEIHLPSFISVQSLFYESFFYNKALLLQTGFDFHFHSFYYADAFMPATGLFYWQAEKKTGGYPLVDFFINFRIKTARFFVKLENIGDNIIDKGYYLTPHYPMQGMTLKFGVNWRFFDQ